MYHDEGRYSPCLEVQVSPIKVGLVAMGGGAAPSWPPGSSPGSPGDGGGGYTRAKYLFIYIFI